MFQAPTYHQQRPLDAENELRVNASSILLSTTTIIGHMQFLYTQVHGRRDGCDHLPVVLLDCVGQELGVDHHADAIGVDWHPRFWVCSQRDGRHGLPVSLAFPCTWDPDLWGWGRGGFGERWRPRSTGHVNWPRQLIMMIIYYLSYRVELMSYRIELRIHRYTKKRLL